MSFSLASEQTQVALVARVQMPRPLVGDLKHSVRNADHNLWLLCDGRSLSRALYPSLFDVIGTSFGNEDELTFKLPDCKGRVLGSVSDAHALGDKVGSEVHQLTQDELPAHSHGSNAVGGVGQPGLAFADGNSTLTNSDYTANNELNLVKTKALTISSTGANQAHNNMQPTLFVGNVFIYSN